MSKQVMIYSSYKAQQGFWLKNQTKIWIKPDKNPLDEDVYDQLLKDSPAFKSEVEAGNIMVHTAKQERKAADRTAELEKKIAQLEEDKAKLQGQVSHLSKQNKPGPKPQGK